MISYLCHADGVNYQRNRGKQLANDIVRKWETGECQRKLKAASESPISEGPMPSSETASAPVMEGPTMTHEAMVAYHVRTLVQLLPGRDEEICALQDDLLYNAAVHFKELLEAELLQRQQAWVFPDVVWPGGDSHDAFASWDTDDHDDYSVAAVSYTHLTLPTIYSV